MRFKFQYLLNILLPKQFEIHHIDLNRKNNNLANLIILKKSLHKKVHIAIKHAPLIRERKYLMEFLRTLKIKKYMLAEVAPKQWRKANQKKGA